MGRELETAHHVPTTGRDLCFPFPCCIHPSPAHHVCQAGPCAGGVASFPMGQRVQGEASYRSPPSLESTVSSVSLSQHPTGYV